MSQLDPMNPAWGEQRAYDRGYAAGQKDAAAKADERIAELEKALRSLAEYAMTVRTDRLQGEAGNEDALQTLDWCNGLLEQVDSAAASLALPLQ